VGSSQFSFKSAGKVARHARAEAPDHGLSATRLRVNPAWEAMVPAVVAEAIKAKNLFGFKSSS